MIYEILKKIQFLKCIGVKHMVKVLFISVLTLILSLFGDSATLALFVFMVTAVAFFVGIGHVYIAFLYLKCENSNFHLSKYFLIRNKIGTHWIRRIGLNNCL